MLLNLICDMQYWHNILHSIPLVIEDGGKPSQDVPASKVCDGNDSMLHAAMLLMTTLLRMTLTKVLQKIQI